MEYSNFLKDFVNRTLFNLKRYESDRQECPHIYEYEVTQLINSLLGLVVFVSEKTNGNNFSNYKEFGELVDRKVIQDTFCDKKNMSLKKSDITSYYLKHFRHSLAHASVEPNYYEGEVSSVIFTNTDIRNKKQKCSFELSISDMYELVLLIEHIVNNAIKE